MNENREGEEDGEMLSTEELISRLYPYIVRVFDIYEIQNSGDTLYFYGTPKINTGEVVGELLVPFQEFELSGSLKHEFGEYILTVTPEKKPKEKVWVNFFLFIATFFTTMVCGASLLFGVNLNDDPSQLIKGLPFALAMMSILGSHEMAHYVMARYHGIKTSLPYFIPFPAFIGTMGAIIHYRGPIPSRKALFDVGIAGPLVGLLVSIVITFIGLNLKAPEIRHLPHSLMYDVGIPPLFMLIQRFTGGVEGNLHPVAFAGWVGMFMTLLNLLPAGQLDGGHVLRAMLGKRAETVSFLMPRILFLLGIYVIYWLKEDGLVWIFWAFLLWAFAAAGHPSPLQDKIQLDKKRILLGIIMFILGLLCFTLIPFKPIT